MYLVFLNNLKEKFAFLFYYSLIVKYHYYCLYIFKETHYSKIFFHLVNGLLMR